jgi:hypothetical protein
MRSSVIAEVAPRVGVHDPAEQLPASVPIEDFNLRARRRRNAADNTGTGRRSH